ncbi:MAG: GNAT family N-acetyltransferase [Candidatus Competibacteraceae bacterium]|nr:GNAT family N-acetyltransferase [Candidatus Competibacteraceae bacterium]
MDTFVIRTLSPVTWDDFASLVERHNGVWGGCWCLEFHEDGRARGLDRKDKKLCHVQRGTAHAALVYKENRCVGWCQFGTPAELPRIKHRKEYENGIDALPDWRVTCFFTDKEFRGRGVSNAALKGALTQIEGLGGGLVESYPEAVAGRKVSASFLYNGSLSLFEHHGFERVRRLGKNHWVVAKHVRENEA